MKLRTAELRRERRRMTKREFLTASIGTGLALAKGSAALAQQASLGTRENSGQPGNRRPASRMAKTTKLFKSPPGFPNALAATPEGLWTASKRSREGPVIKEPRAASDQAAYAAVGNAPELVVATSSSPPEEEPAAIGIGRCSKLYQASMC